MILAVPAALLWSCMETHFRSRFAQALRRITILVTVIWVTTTAYSSDALLEDPLRLPEVGWNKLRVVSPTVLELTLVTTKDRDPAPVQQWNFVRGEGDLRLPNVAAFKVIGNGKTVPVERVGFKRRVLYAPLKKRDLRIGNYLYLQLRTPLSDNTDVRVETTD